MFFSGSLLWVVGSYSLGYWAATSYTFRTRLLLVLITSEVFPFCTVKNLNTGTDPFITASQPSASSRRLANIHGD